MPGESRKAVVYLSNEENEDIQLLIDDDWLYENDVVEGSIWKWALEND